MAMLFFLIISWVVLTRVVRICNQCKELPTISTVYLYYMIIVQVFCAIMWNKPFRVRVICRKSDEKLLDNILLLKFARYYRLISPMRPQYILGPAHFCLWKVDIKCLKAFLRFMQGLKMRTQKDLANMYNQVCTGHNILAYIFQCQIRHQYTNSKVVLIYLLKLHLV